MESCRQPLVSMAVADETPESALQGTSRRLARRGTLAPTLKQLAGRFLDERRRRVSLRRCLPSELLKQVIGEIDRRRICH